MKYEVRFIRDMVRWDWPVTTARVPDAITVTANSAPHAETIIKRRYSNVQICCTLPVGLL